MSTAQISFVVPVYNVKPYLEQCLESIISINVEKEIILIDDGSTDGSRDILEQYQQKYPYITLVCQSNKGVSVARNIGIKLAKGEFIQFVDSDDFLLDTNYDLLIKHAKNNNADILRFQYLWFMPDGQNFSLYPPVLVNLSQIPESAIFAQSNGIIYLNKLYEKQVLPGIVLGFFRTSTLRKYNLHFFEHISAVEDQLFLMEMLSKTNIQVIEYLKPVYGYRFNTQSLSQKSNNVKFIRDGFKACDILWQELIHSQDDEIKHIIYGTIMRNYNMIYHSHYLKLSEENKRIVKDLFSQEIISQLERFFNSKIEL